jgi:ABC-type Fe3+ transport system substrate-binding protein
VTAAVLKEFQDQGLGRNIKPLRVPDATNLSLGPSAWYLSRAPHPNAARLFANWLLTREGQAAFARSTNQNSRRKDVSPGNPSTVPDASINYKMRIGDEESADALNQTTAILTRLVG